MSSNSTRGGARPGAGRKPVQEQEKRVVLSCRVKPSTIKRIRSISEQSGQSVGEVIDDLSQK